MKEKLIIGRVYPHDFWNWSSHFNEGLCCVRKDTRYGFVDRTGRLVIDCVWDDANHFYRNVARVMRDGTDHWIDTHGNVHSSREKAEEAIHYRRNLSRI